MFSPVGLALMTLPKAQKIGVPGLLALVFGFSLLLIALAAPAQDVGNVDQGSGNVQFGVLSRSESGAEPPMPAGAGSGNIVIVVQTTLYNWGIIDAALNQYMADLTREGYTPQLYVCAEGSGYDCDDLRAYLKSVYDTQGLVGAAFIEANDIGAVIPRARMWDYSPTDDHGPVDLFYMDLDGLWTRHPEHPDYFMWTAEGEGWENWEHGDMAPEIWVGRISTIMTAGDRLNPYFDRVHDFRTGVFPFQNRAITFVAEPFGSMDHVVSIAYPDITSYGHGTTKSQYISAVQSNYEHEYHGSHSTATANAWITSTDIPFVNPKIGWYYIWGCHSGDFDASLTCLSCEYVFSTTYGLGCFASACSGGINAHTRWYTPISEGYSAGEAAYLLFLNSANPDGSLPQGTVDWGWGMITFGDPTLRPRGTPIPDDIHITDVYWDEATSSVKVTFSTQDGLPYLLQGTDADAYADGLTWTTITSTTASGDETTLADDLSTPLTADFRFYRIKRSDVARISQKAVGLFELDLVIGWTMQDFFVSTPLIPDTDHDSVQQVIGTQINRNAPNIRQRVADTGINNRMVYNRTAGTWSADVGSAFDIAPGEGYKLFAGGGIAQTVTVRLTGYVPDEALSVLVAKPGWTQTDRWLAYSMPRPRTLDTLGLRESVTGWNSMNTLKLRPLGSGVWTTYKWDGAKWYDITDPDENAGSTPTACGEAVVFTRFGTPIAVDQWVQSTWYFHPPNAW